MSALPARPTQTGQPAQSAVTASTAPGRAHLRLVHSRPPRGLAPTGPIQAWRRRIGLLVVLAAIVAAAWSAIAPAADVSVPATVPVSAATVVVEPGETLWDVAARTAPEGTDTATQVAEIVAANGLAGVSVDAWQVLLLPVG